MKKQLSMILIAVLVLSMVLAGCNNNTGGNSTGASTGGSPQAGGEASAGTEPAGNPDITKDTLIVAAKNEPSSLDPAGKNDGDSTKFKHLIFDTLLRQGDDKSAQPNLAESWEYTDDTTLIMKIREGVKFHNGNDLTAGDILFTLGRAKTSDFASWMVEAIDLEATTVTDDYTLEIKLTQPTGAQLSQFCFLYVVDEQTVTEMGDEAFAEKPVGTGPFIFKEWFRGDRVEYTTNKDYWGQVAPYNNLTMRVISESSSRTMEVESGGVDVALDIVSSDVELLQGNNDVNLLRTPSFSNVFVAFNCSAEPFKDNPKLRQAVSYAIDKNAVVQAVYSGMGSAATGPIGPSIWGYTTNVTSYTQDQEKAKTLLAEAGYPDGLEITITISDSQERVDIAEILQNQLGQVGITMKVETLENATFLDRIIAADTQMFILGWTTNTGDADYGLYEPFYTGMPTWANTATYSNPAVDEQLDIGRTSTDDAARMAAYEKAQQLIAEDAPWIFLYDKEEIAAARSNIVGLKSPPSGRYDFNTISFTN